MWLIAGLAVYFWPWVLGAVAVGVAVWLVRSSTRAIRAAREADRARSRAIAERADQQHTWVLDGDERGLYGNYPPAA